MNDFTFYSPTEFVFGREKETQVGSLCRKYGATMVMVVYGGGSVVRSGLLVRVEMSLTQAGVPYVELGGVQPNPTDPKVYEGISICRSKNVDFMLPIGGGSVIDTAKAIAAGVPYKGDFWDFYSGKAKVERALTVGVVLTIPAAGSEGSGNTVITKLDGLHKISLRAPEHLRPAFSILNPELTFTLPKRQTMSGIADMMVHVFERYFTNTENVQVAQRLCEGILLTIIEEAPKVLADPTDYDARANIEWCGTVAHNGICGVGCEEDWASHFIEHEVSALYGVTHGEGLTAIFPAWATWMVTHNVTKVYQMAVRVFGVAESDDRQAVALEGIARLKAFWHSLGLPLSLHELGIHNPDLDLLVEKLHATKGERVGNYVKLTRTDTREILEMAR